MKENKETAGAALLSAEERELLDLLLAEEGIELPREQAIARRKDAGPAPLSFAQQRLWFLHQLDPSNPVYNLPTAVRLTGRLDASALARTLGEVTRRHESLRTTFATGADGLPVQLVAPHAEAELPLVDLSHLDEAAREAEAARLAAEEAARPFDLARGPLLRAQLLRLGAEEHVVLLTMHHIASDAWSRGVLVREVAALYEAFSRGQGSPLAELPAQYADYAVWQREWLQGDELERQLSYWRAQLANVPHLQLPTDRPRPAVQSFRGAVESFMLDADLTARLGELSRREGASLFMTLLAGFKALLARYSRQTDVTVGTPVAGRNRVELESMIGFFINTLVLRTDLSGDPTFAELVGRERETTLAAYAHQDIPFEKLVEELQPERSLSHTPIFQVVFTFQNAPRETLELPGLRLAAQASEGRTAKFDLTLVMEETARGLVGSFEYNTDIFEAATVRRLISHFENLLRAAADDPSRTISALPLLGEEEARELVAALGRGGRDFSRPETLHELFERRAQAAPDAEAVSFGAERVSYAELNRRANRLARRLRRAGVGPEVAVALLLERSIDLVVAVLGVLKAGGAYVPLDPEYPRERLEFMLADSAAPVALTHTHLRERLPDASARVLCLDAEGDAGDGDENLGVAVAPGNLAYVIYTSGSTGRPKGVPVTHANVTRLFAATGEWFRFDERDVWTLFHSYAFDFSVWELWGALLYGGRLAVVPYLVSRAPAEFYELLRRERVTVLNQTPSAFRQLMQAEAQADADAGELSLRCVVFGGEALELQSLRPWFGRHGDARPLLVNMYGITETTVHVTYRPVRMADVEGGAGSIIGRPIPDLSLYVLDEHLRPQPRGVAGEVYVGGAGLARGYLGRAALAAERFVPDPFGGEAGARLYRTGDLARLTSAGELEYVGRIDSQVKIRGFRIELGEVEAALASHPAVGECCVVAREEEGGERRLVAYVVAGAGRDESSAGLSAGELRAHLNERLPEHMIPSAFVALDKLPLTPHGKVDRKALPEPETTRAGRGDDFSPPATPAEEVLAAIWAEVLGLDEVGAEDNFFDLGGDSIRSVRILAAARQRGLDLSLQQLFRHQTIRELAREAAPSSEQAARAASKPFSLVAEADRAKLPDDAEDAYPLTMLQAGMLFHMELAPEASVYHNVNSWHLRARFEPEAFESAVGEVVARHPVLRTSFALTGYSEPLQIVRREATIPVALHDLRGLAHDEQDAALNEFVAREKRNRFDLTRAPLISFHIHLRSAESFQFSLTECHAILDGWSLNSTLSEIFGRYFALLRGETPPAEPTPAATFRDFVALERQALESEEARRFWREKLSGSTVMRLPRWPSRPGPAAERFSRINVPITDELSEGLRQVARAAQVPLKSVLLAAHMKVLSLISGQEDVLGGIVANGRAEEAGGEQVRGLFLNTLPFRLRLAPGTWADLVRQTFEAEWEALPFRRYPLFALQREQGGRPLFETQFNYVHFHTLDGVLRSGEVEVVARDTKAVEEIDYTLDAAFSVNPLTHQLRLNFQFDSWALGHAQAEAVAGYYTGALAAIARDPGARHDAESLLPPAERRRLLAEWNDTAADYDLTRCVHELFEDEAARRPDAPAVVAGAEGVTYGELNRRADHLARRLRGAGVGPEVVVGILAERSVEMIVALLGVLKAGGAYLPLDPDYPRERLEFMLRDSGAAVLLAQGRFLEAAPAQPGTRVLRLEEDGGDEPHASAESEDEQGRSVRPEHLAYVIYTSGSTGRPKGVMVSHRNLVHSTRARQSYYDERVSAFLLASPFSFDSSVAGLFWTLLDGGTLVLPRQNFQQDLARFIETLAERRVSHLLCLPSLYSVLLEQAAPGRLDSLRAVIVAGEPCPAALVRRHHERQPNCRMFNEYGPTEGTVWCSVHRCDPADEHPSVPIGRPIANAQIYLLGRRLQPAPTGVPGELYLSGAGLARGYLGRAALTAERFIPHPFAATPGARLYRTGDLARYLPGGEIEFLGRADDQVKVRGYRIELGEIESVLSEHAAVRECVVAALPDASGDAAGQRLVAYFVAADAQAPPAARSLRDYAAERLPAHMIPSAFVALEQMPLTPNGKVDRNALPDTAGLRSELAAAYLAPRNEAERAVADIWRRLLGVEQVGVNDNFFDLGGHSLLLARVHAELRELYPHDIPLVALFQHPTVGALAEYLSRGGRDDSEALRQTQERAAARRRLTQQQRGRRAQRRGADAPQLAGQLDSEQAAGDASAEGQVTG